MYTITVSCSEPIFDYTVLLSASSFNFKDYSAIKLVCKQHKLCNQRLSTKLANFGGIPILTEDPFAHHCIPSSHVCSSARNTLWSHLVLCRTHSAGKSFKTSKVKTYFFSVRLQNWVLIVFFVIENLSELL